MSRKRKPDPEFAVRAEPQRLNSSGARLCMACGCDDVADSPAPKNRNELRNYIWFCLEHIRDFNQSWNYYDGLEGEALEKEIRNATTWERPSWKFGTAGASQAYQAQIEDGFGLFEDDLDPRQAKRSELSAEEKAAWALFDLPPDSDLATVKKRYNELAKKYHPDYHQNDADAEDKLKEINLAYSVLRKKVIDLNNSAA